MILLLLIKKNPGHVYDRGYDLVVMRDSTTHSLGELMTTRCKPVSFHTAFPAGADNNVPSSGDIPYSI